jgi:hypothetical protein
MAFYTRPGCSGYRRSRLGPPRPTPLNDFAQFATSQGDSVLYGTALHKNSAREFLRVLLVSLKPLGALS